jgi:hypothetical protein
MTSPPTKILPRTFCFHDSMTLSMKDQQRTNLGNQDINNVTIRLVYLGSSIISRLDTCDDREAILNAEVTLQRPVRVKC